MSDKENLLNQKPLSSICDSVAKRQERHRSRSRDRAPPRDDHRRNDRKDRNDRNGRAGGSSDSAFPYCKVVNAPPDEKLGNLQDDPRGNDTSTRITKKGTGRGHGRNTESFDPASTLVRPDLRIQIGSPEISAYTKTLKHDDVIIVPELFGKEENWNIYYKVVDEMRALQKEAASEKENKGSEWISWHEGAHLISKNPKGSPTYNMIVDRLCEYFSIDKSKDVGTRFNWYRDSSPTLSS